MADNSLQIGQRYTRHQVAEIAGGGSPQGGIVSVPPDYVLIYSDPAEGEKYGYRDGWLPEEDELDPIFEYTGHGYGHQTFTGSAGTGNRLILRHVELGRELLVFIADGTVEGPSNTKLHRYVGRFELDPQEPYVDDRWARNRQQELRRVIVFRLRPAGDFYRDEKHVAAPADTTEVEVVPVEAAVTSETTTVVSKTESKTKTSSTRSEVPKTKAELREGKLTTAFEDFLKAKNHEVGRLGVRVKGRTSTLWNDLFDVTENVLYEAKGDVRRESVRMAIGQLFDYQWLAAHSSPPIEGTRLAVLLPRYPGEDIRDLLESLNIALVYHQDGDSFAGFPLPS